MRKEKASLYLHIPFCEKKCLYCDFYSIENGASMESFLHALHAEIDLRAEYASEASFETVFFGGGTPSLLSPGQLGDILRHLRSVFTVDADAEITVETNPGTVTAEKLAAYRSLGANRLSIGIQSFDESDLKFLSRIHSADEAVRCVQDAKAAGFTNLNIDLIFSLPGQTLEAWRANLDRALALDPSHISAYSLIVEDHTPLARMVGTGEVSPNSMELEAELYMLTMTALENAGFEHYEVSNYARPGFRSRHNSNYWRHRSYLGFGPSAHSFWRRRDSGHGQRWWNIANLSTYRERLSAGRLPVVAGEDLDFGSSLTERIFLGLRSDGVDLQRLQADYGFDLLHRQHALIRQLMDEGDVVMENHALRLTPKGYLLCDEICERLIPGSP